ncbi:PREDICTED: neprilysin-like [Wasmannia auropunctata]|uniref:neprilysin-like n=1 Tax=Wasmannia auropunctata TaxID=64793 RepID=UPI0005EE3115|nr:PREDICTED: neprilysin-like [Wasmannia auropunctata]XP_011689429.1 PREDICTED: neprilysin-like [Wasmannia auropunctata]
MRRFILLAFISVLLIKNVTPKNQRYPSHLEWLFGLNKNLNENKEENKEENKPTVCQSQECKKIAQIVSESMDKSVDPCDDFYEYACGKWPEHNPIPKGMNSWSTLASAQRNVTKQIKKIFDEGPKDDDILAVKLAKKWYAVCMDTNAMDKQGLEPLVFTLARIGGWPMIMEPDEWNEQEYSWQKVDDQYVRLIGRNAFHDVWVKEYGSNESRKVVYISTPHLPPGSNNLRDKLYTGEEDESDEDTSDEEKQSDEQNDSQETGSEDTDDNKSENNSNNDDENDNNDDKDDNNDYNDDDDKNTKKISVKKTGKLAKNKQLGYSRKIKNSAFSKKYKNHKTKKERVKRQAIPTNVREKLRARTNDRNHMKQARKKKSEKILEVTTSRCTEEPTVEIDEIKKYTDYISKVVRAIAKARGAKVSAEHMNKDIKDMIKFQLKLIKISTKKSKEEKEEKKEITLNDMQEWYDEKNPETFNSAIDWMYKIGELFDEAHVSVDSDLNVEIGSPEYLEGLISLLDETPSRTIVNYIHWNFLSRIITTTTSEMRKLYNAWEKQKNDDDEFSLNRARKCTRQVEMNNMLAYEYVRNHFSDDITTTASDMMDDIQKEVEYQIKESDWMDEDTNDFVLAKLVNMNKFIGYPDWYRNDTIVKRYFQGLIIGNSFYENTMSYERYNKWKRLRKLLKEDKEDNMMMMSPLMVNAFFSAKFNLAAFSAADFQSPMFAYDRPRAINYGIIGTIMGHEVNHGFDSRGHLYDKNGEFVEWLSAMSDVYGKRAECFVEQFNNYPVDKESNYKVKNYGNQTARENIADTMGIEAAFRAYQRRERECGKSDTVLPGLEDLTSDQLFFLSFANLCCEIDKDIIKSAKSDVHSTGRLRVIGSVSNSQDFAKAYNCPVGSAMNPERKCHIWK